MKFKCLYCGCEKEFVEVKLAEVLLVADAGHYVQLGKSYSCTECGFVQIFDKEQVLRIKEKKNEPIKTSDSWRYI